MKRFVLTYILFPVLIVALVCVALADATINPSPSCLGDFSADNPASTSYYSTAAAASAAAGAGATLDTDADANGIWGAYKKTVNVVRADWEACMQAHFSGRIITYSEPAAPPCVKTKMDGYSCYGVGANTWFYTCDGVGYIYLFGMTSSAYEDRIQTFAYPLPGHAICASSDGDGDGIADEYDLNPDTADDDFDFRLIGIYYDESGNRVGFRIRNLENGMFYDLGDYDDIKEARIAGRYSLIYYVGEAPVHNTRNLADTFGPNPEVEPGSLISPYDYTSYGTPDGDSTMPATGDLVPGDSSEKVTYGQGEASDSADLDSDLLKKIVDNTNANLTGQKAQGDLLVGIGSQLTGVIGKIPASGDIGAEVGNRLEAYGKAQNNASSDYADGAGNSLSGEVSGNHEGYDNSDLTAPTTDTETGVFEGIVSEFLGRAEDVSGAIDVSSSGSQCSFSIDVLGHNTTLNMCKYSDVVGTIGSVLLGCCYLSGLFIVFRKNG